MKKILLALIIGAMFSAVGFAIAAPSVFRSTVMPWKDVPEVNLNTTKRIYYSQGSYLTKFNDGFATCYLYQSSANGVALSCLK